MMNISINDRSCTSAIGDTLLKAARINHCDAGFLCCENGICQTCYVTVKDGNECLSPLSDVERAFLSPRQIESGGRLACQAIIVNEGKIAVVTRPEEVRNMFFSDPSSLFKYGAEIGGDTARQVVPGLINLATRMMQGKLSSGDALEDLKVSVAGVADLALKTLPEYLPFKNEIMGMVSGLPEKFQDQLSSFIPFETPFAKKRTHENFEKVVIRFNPDTP